MMSQGKPNSESKRAEFSSESTVGQLVCLKSVSKKFQGSTSSNSPKGSLVEETFLSP